MKKIASVLFCCLMLFACQTGQDKSGDGTNDKSGKLDIVTTTGMIGDVVKNVVGDKANVNSFMGPGVDPHLYKATQRDLNNLTNADVIFYNGLFLEGKMEGILEKLAKKKPCYAISEKIDKSRLLMMDYEGKSEPIADPHIWFNVDLWSSSVDVIAERMSKQDPTNAQYYKDNAKAYKTKLANLHQKAKKEFTSLPEDQRTLITSHDAFTYFGDAYNINVEALQGVSTVTEFGLKDVSNMVDMIVDKKIKAVFVESSVPRKPLEAVLEGCKSKGHDVVIGGELYSDAMGAEGTEGGTYIGMIEHNLKTIVNALK